MTSKHFFYRFILALFLSLVVSFVIHFVVLKSIDESFATNLLVVTYLGLLAMTTLIVFAIYKFQKKYFSQVGFLFLAGSLLKFAFYFTLLKPYYAHYELPKTKAFLVFFIPYLISLITESLYVSKLLNKGNQSRDN